MRLTIYHKIIFAALILFVIYRIAKNKTRERAEAADNENTHDQHPTDPLPDQQDDQQPDQDKEDDFDYSRNRKLKSDLINASFEVTK